MQLENAIVFGSLAMATVLVVAAAARATTLKKLGDRMGPPNWDFSKSWGSSFTVLGAVLGTIVAAKGVIPDQPKFLTQPGGYAALNLAFGLIIVLAPFLYRALSSPVPVGGAEPQYEGYVWSFLVCTLLTVWAVLGQLAVGCGALEAREARRRATWWRRSRERADPL